MLSPHHRRRLPLTLLAALLLALPLAAQDAEPEEPEPEAEETAAPATPAGSPFEYEASEQISEDLSVSFPVDI
ncbi:hypothetical protein Q6D67_13025 [Haliea sp. E1-2-M8]|uniref:hypothetical protein n=1 Tax=Haliea sp. E1-2-M8 TaxID=3064706 RepID=UPI0027286DF1|nr:hypothetical protein [Haliea sp. E1-2-M8]MDO8862626.1 hypothetical protein [Haliea sp. E1-2-M8]